MLRRLLVLLAMLLLPSLTLAREGWRGFCEDGNQSVVTSGISSSTKVQRSFPQCQVLVLVHGGGVATIFADNNNTPLANPFQANLDGSWIFYANDGRYDIQITQGSGLSFTYLDVLLCDPFVPGAVCAAGGGAGSSHNLLSTTHLDTVPFSPPVRGDLITAQNQTSPTGVNPSWARLPLGANNFVLTSNGVDAVWAAVPSSSGCTVGSLLDTWIVFIHPNATCAGSTKLTWDNTNQALSSGDGTTTFFNVKTVFNLGVSNAIKDVVDPGSGSTGLVIGDSNNLWGIPVTTSQELYIIGDSNNNQRNTSEAYIIGNGNGIVDTTSNNFILGNSNHFKSGTVSTQATIQHGFAVGGSNNATVTPTGTLNDYGFTGFGNTLTISSGRAITNVFLHGISNTATLTTNNDHDIYALGSSNTFEDDLNLTEQVLSLGFGNDIDGANSTAQTLGISNILHNVSINGGNTVVVGGVNAATTLGTLSTQYQEVFGHSNNLNNCSDCIAIGANVNEATNHEMGIGMAATPAIKVAVNGSGDNILRTPHAFSYYPACSGGIEGSWASVTDAVTSTAGVIISGGGSNHVLGYCNGTNWVVSGAGLGSGKGTISITDIAPVVGDDGLILVIDPAQAIHLTRFACGVQGTTSVVANMVKGGNSLIADATCTAGSVETVTTSTFVNGSGQCGGTSSCAIAAHAPVTLHIGTISGTPTALQVAVEFTVD